MAKPKVNVRIDGTMVLACLAIAAGVYLYYKKEEVEEVVTVGLNPTNADNYVNLGLQSAVGEEKLATFSDHYFGVLFNFTPWALFASDEQKRYGRQVWSNTLGLN